MRDTVLGGLIGGNVCALVSAGLNPFDTVKIRMQNQSNTSVYKYNGLISGTIKLLRDEGIAGWTRGLTASMIREVTYSSVRMGAYAPIRDSVTAIVRLQSNNNDNGNGNSNSDSNSDRNSDSNSNSNNRTAVVTTGSDSNPIIKFSSALVSGGVGAAIANPLDLIKTRFQSALPNEPRPYASTAAAFRDIFRAEGIGGLYKGWVITSSRAAVLTSAQLGSYDSIKNNLLIQTLGLEEGFLLHFASSMLAGLITTTAANPIDVVKTRYMADKAGFYKGPLHCVIDTFQKEGPTGFFKGWVPAYWRLGPHTVLSLLLIEKIRILFGLKPI